MIEPPRVKPVLVNNHERVADRLLTAEAALHGERLLAKVRLADVIDIDNDRSRSYQGYAMAAHFDFLMVDPVKSLPRFAVELDGSSHWSDPDVRRRDRLKDQLCDWAQLPILRITSDFGRKAGRWTVLSYVIDALYRSEAFYDAQNSGAIPFDEPFILTSGIVLNENNESEFYALDQLGRMVLLGEFKAGRLPTYCPDEYTTFNDATGTVSAHALLAVAPSRFLVGRSEIRDFKFPGIAASELAGQLAVAEVGDLAQRWLQGEAVACDVDRLARYMHEVQDRIDAGGFRSFSGGSGLRGGGSLAGVARIDVDRRRR